MPNQVRWKTPDSPTTVLNTEMNTLGNNTLSAAGTDYDNSSTKHMYADFELILGSLAPAAGGYISLYLAEAPDGSNFSDVKRESFPQLLGSFPLDTASAAKRQVIRNIMLPPTHFKVYVDNQAGVSLAGSGANYVKMYPYDPEIQ